MTSHKGQRGGDVKRVIVRVDRQTARAVESMASTAGVSTTALCVAIFELVALEEAEGDAAFTTYDKRAAWIARRAREIDGSRRQRTSTVRTTEQGAT